MKTRISVQERLKDLRVEQGLNLEELAQKTGISKSALGSYENDNDEYALCRLHLRSWKFPLSDNSSGRQHSLLSPLDCLPAKAGGTVNGGAVHLDR